MEPNQALSATTFFIFLFTFTIDSAVLPALAVDSRYSNCSLPLVCGRHNYRRTYPFWGVGKNEYCGRPGFELKCRGQQDLLLETGSQTLRVLNLSQSGTITVALDSLWSDDCPRTFVFPESGFKYFEPPSLQNISLYDCDTPQPVPSFSCRSSTYYIRLSSEPSTNFGDCERKIDIPIPASVPESVFEQSRNPLGIFKQGFNLTYADDDTVCEACSESGGICGWDQETEKFQCFCRGKPHKAVCSLTGGNGRFSKAAIIAIALLVSVSTMFCFIGSFLLARRRRKKYNTIPKANVRNDLNDIITVESLQFDFGTIEFSTNNFSDDNKLGAGGFGVVYKGNLSNGQEIAVKRLSRSSGQGVEEFKNEVLVVAKLQHKNLVRLLGFCLEREERILIYDFVSNKSLDYFLFDQEKQGLLDWSRRYKIMEGVARGILYLHRDSRLTIIHRDIKASNILLDCDMNPKISDFGMARIFSIHQTQGNTNRIAGTYGYMSPEYAMYGQFSMKSDIYSFGVLLLEMISGKKNNTFYQSNGIGNLISYAWKLWRDGSALELSDSTLGDNYHRDQVIQCIHIGLLCVQEDMEKRPTITVILHMLEDNSVSLPAPQQPGFYFGRGDKSGQDKRVPSSVAEVSSLTEFHPR